MSKRRQQVRAHPLYKLWKDIIESEKRSKALGKEVQRVFDLANKRIQRLEAQNLYSPALQALSLPIGHPRSVFSMKGKDWFSIKILYEKAAQFINDETSTISGAKKYKQRIIEVTGIDESTFTAVVDVLKKKGGRVEAAFEALTAKQIAKYEHLLEYIERVLGGLDNALKSPISDNVIAAMDTLIDRADMYEREAKGVAMDSDPLIRAINEIRHPYG